jgi:Ca-activated chloride channel family protein
MKTLSFLILMLAGLASFAQQTPTSTCSIYGKLTDKSTGEEIPFANVILYKDSAQVDVRTTDLNGSYSFKNINAGIYKVTAVYVGYAKATVTGIHVTKATKVDILLSGNSTKLDEVMVVQNATTVNANTTSGVTITREEYARAAGKASADKSVAYKKSKEKAPVFGYTQAQDYNTEEYSRIYDNEFKDSKKDPLSTFSIDVDKASYSNVRRFLNQQQLPQADAVRIEEMINYFSYEYPKPEGNQPFSITTEYTDCPWNNKHQLVHIGLQGKEIAMDHLPANNLVFLIDVSGSMNSEDKLPLLKSGLRLLVEQMRPQDHVAIVVYAGAAGVVLPSTSGNHKDKMYDALEKLQAGGSTAGGEGILLAYKTAKENFMTKGNNRIILATDGDFNVGVSSDGELTRLIEQQREDGVFLSVLGFGTGNYKDSKMEQLADKGNGNYAYIDNILEAKKVLVKEMGGTLLTIAKDVKLQIEFNPAKVKGYRLVGYENRLLNNEDFNDDKKDAGELGSGHTVTAIYEIIPAGSPELIASVDNLKYQQTTTSNASGSNEVMTIKFRYKEPKESTSQLITHIVSDNKTPFSMASGNCKFSVAVAEFGMLLRDSKFKGDSDFKTVIATAKAAKGKDEEGYRAEFIRLVEIAELLKK